MNARTSTIGKTINLNTYIYYGLDANKHKVSGECKAKTKSAAKFQVEAKGIKVTKINKKTESIFKKKSIKEKDIVLFTRQLSTMLRSGIPIIQSLEVSANVTNNSQMSDMISNIKTSLETGHSLSEALNLYPKQFNSFYRNLLKVGESTGKLDLMLLRIADYQEKMLRLKSKFVKALLYPGIIVAVAVIVTAVLLIYVVPQFESMFANLNSELPWFTQFILNISRWMQAYWFYCLTGLMIIFYLTNRYMKKSEKGQILLDAISLKIPIIGSIINKICLARFARTLTTMLSSGIPLLNSLPTASNLVGNNVYKKAIHDIIDEVETGQLLNKAMQNNSLFNNMIVQMTAIGENSGTLDEMLLKVAELYEEEVDSTVENLSNIIEPIIILIISVLVGGLIVAMYLPIFSLGSAL